jgi:serine/threonine protein kinase/tetratricopeptide (TPR) repeat protein
MNPTRWAELSERFAELADAPAEVQRAALTAIEDPALRAELARMFEAHRGEPLAFEAAVGEGANAQTAHPAEPADGTSGVPPKEFVGPYRLLSLLGRGGMGEVWLAERDEPGFRRRVAVKRVHRGLGSEELRRRFEIERLALARLSHRGIAQLLDGGIDDDGVPYLVLEYVEGAPITVVADRQRLSVAERLALFLEVCEAVAYAHRHLVVHRDLKPSNLFVSEAGEVRLLDFGIAKLLDPASSPLGETRTAMRLATPEYASPEQLAGEPVTTATDVHGLGLLLFELLTGQRAFRDQETSARQLEEAVRTLDPRRPSVVVGLAEDRTAIAAARATTPAALARLLRGDLDTIVATALRKDPARRYASVEQLAEDVARWRSGQPIRARPDRLGYRLAKFVGRHRIGVVAAAAALVLLVGFAAYAWRQSVLLERERDTARLERDKAQEISGFLVDLFGADPYADDEGIRDSTTVGEFLARSEETVRRELAERPALRAALLGRLARLRGNLGQLADARRLAEEALAIRRGLPGDQRADVAESLTTLATIHQDEDDFDTAEAMFREALALREAAFPPVHPEVAEAVHNLAGVLFLRDELRDPGEAERLGRRGLELRRELFGDAHPDTIQSLNTFGVFLYRRRAAGDLAAAEQLFRDVIAARIARLGADHPTVANARNNLGKALAAQGRPAEAVPLYREAIAGWSRALGPDHLRVAHGLRGLADALIAAGRPGEAEEPLRQALQVDARRLAADDPDLAAGELRLAGLLLDLGRPAEAAPLLARAAPLLAAAGADYSEEAAAASSLLGRIRGAPDGSEVAVGAAPDGDGPGAAAPEASGDGARPSRPAGAPGRPGPAASATPGAPVTAP